ncbi:hypothetical protein AA313_de0200863 [Arthrobotrys entomopaga]|nr:hypothetical protein AA313_de0200863 [Arthrobotrys entomopaga]
MDPVDNPPPPGFDEPNQILLRGPAATTTDNSSLDQTAAAPPPAAEVSSTKPSTTGTTTTTTTTSETQSSSGKEPSSPSPPPPPPLQKRRTSSFEYKEDGPSQYDTLQLTSKGDKPLSPVFLDLLRAKIREAERQLHFALLSTSTRDRHDASKRCSCALAELDYVRTRVYLPPPIQLLETRILRSTALTSLYLHTGGDGGSSDRVLDAKKAESLIQRAFQVLGELIDWERVKKQGAAVEMLEEFLPMCYFNGQHPSATNKSGNNTEKEEGGEQGRVDFTETMALWYQMMIDHARITISKAQWKQGTFGRKEIKIENYAKAAKMFGVGLEGLKEVYEGLDHTDSEYLDYKKSGDEGLQQVVDIVVSHWKQDELVEIVESTSKLDCEDIKIRIMKARLRASEREVEAKKRQQQEIEDGLGPPKTPAIDDGDDNEDDQESAVKDKGKGKARADDDDDDDDHNTVTPISPKPISAKDKGKGKAVILKNDEEEDGRGLPSYSDAQKTKEDEWVIVEPKN